MPVVNTRYCQKSPPWGRWVSYYYFEVARQQNAVVQWLTLLLKAGGSERTRVFSTPAACHHVSPPVCTHTVRMASLWLRACCRITSQPCCFCCFQSKSPAPRRLRCRTSSGTLLGTGPLSILMTSHSNTSFNYICDAVHTHTHTTTCHSYTAIVYWI